MKNIDKKRKVQLFIIFMIVIALLAGSVTYALIELNIIYRGNQENTISSCSFNIDIKENNPINLVSTYPMDDNEAIKLEPYKFSITPNSQTCSKLQYNITIVSNCDTCTKTNGICNDNNLCNCNEGYQIDPNLIKYEITNKTTGEKTVGINPYKMGVAGSMTVGTTINFELRMWIINSATNDDLYIKENGSYKEDSNGLILTKNFCSKVKITGTDDPYLTPLDISGANKPVLASNMIPVYYDETAETWKKANTSNKDKNNPWYSYNSSGDYKGMWANAVTVTETNRATYLNATPGTTIPMDDITTMWVWIPRFNAVTPSNYNGGTREAPGAIDVTFVKENETAIDAFTFGDKELSGFWYGKFEIGGTLASACTNETCNVNNIVVKPNVTSIRSQIVSSFFFAARSMEQSGNSFGFVNTEVDTHMSKNNEWGAVAYLTQSIYGRCTNRTTCSEVYINNSRGFYTGRSGGAAGKTPINGTYTDQTSTTNYNTYGFYTYDDYLLDYNTNTKGNKVKGKGTGASTTGTIYGIYDMSGGAYDYMMGVFADSSGNPRSGYSSSANSGFTGMLYDGTTYTGVSFPDSKYYNLYTGSSYTGHALTETKNWYSDNASFVSSFAPWFIRGGYYDNGTNAGVFNFNYLDGDSFSYNSSRLVISNE